MTEEKNIDFNDIALDDEVIEHYGTPQLYPGDPHGSGRYREGSGDNPNQHGHDDFLSRIKELKRQGMTDTQVAHALGMSTTEYRVRRTIALNERRAQLVDRVWSLDKQGYSNVQIAEIMGLAGESTVRSLKNADSKARMTIAEKTANNLANLVDERGMIDVGVGTERQLGISKEKMAAALKILELEGYEVYGGRVPQVTNKGQYTTIKVLCPPGTEHKEIYEYDKVHSIDDLTSRDGGDTLEPSFRYPASMSSNRLAIRYAEQGGADRDGQVEIRRGVKDLYMGDGVNYAQVRILVDDTHYIKGMGIYSDDLPDGVDVMFNSNKSINKSPNKLDYLKPIEENIKKDPDNPFGSAIKENRGQVYYDDPNGKYTDPVTGKKQSLGLINKRSEEGDWNDWSDKVPSQFLSKQPQKLIDRQLKESLNEKKAEYDEIMSLTNPTIKRSLLETFADDCDSSSVHLKAAALPGQKYQVILPLTTIGDNEVYAPNYKDGSQVALIRYPHGGTFEIPIVTVNNRNEEGKRNLTSNPKDAIGINSNVASRLSGADFDGDTVMVIPLSDKIKVKSTKQLEALKGFDTKMAYGADETWTDKDGIKHYSRAGKEYKIMNNTQTEMGIISNLITDMTLGGATNDELARAVKHSMVVIDAEKHKLDYKQSALDNGIDQLHKKYQGHIDPETGKYREGAATLISRAKSEIQIPERKEGAFYTKDSKEKVVLDPETKSYFKVSTGELVPQSKVKIFYTDPNTGEKVYRDTGRMYTTVEYKDKSGKKQSASVITKDGKQYYKDKDSGLYKEVTNEKITNKLALQKSTRMAETNDAYTLSRGSLPEQAYAEYANSLKELANRARLEALNQKDIPYSSAAKQTYKDEVDSLQTKLNEALLNAPKERQAQLIANSIIKAKLDKAEGMDSDHEKKIRQQALSKARKQVGAKRTPVQITDKEWEAIQAGAISTNALKQILNNADSDTLKQLAMPRTTTTLSTSKVNRIKSMSNRGYTTNEIANALGISTTTVIKYLKG